MTIKKRGLKKLGIVTFLSTIMLAGGALPNISHASSINTSSKAVIQQQLEAFDKVDEEIRANRSEVVKADKGSNGLARAGTYPTRKGVILVTKDGKFGSLVGHAGIVYSSGSTVESFPDTGVATFSNNWNSKYSTVYGETTSGTTITQDANAANRAYSHRGKAYNWNFTDINTTSKFYCSQLVYEGYKYATGLNLNQGGGIVAPIDLVQSSHTYTIYTKGV